MRSNPSGFQSMVPKCPFGLALGPGKRLYVSAGPGSGGLVICELGRVGGRGLRAGHGAQRGRSVSQVHAAPAAVPQSVRALQVRADSAAL